MKRDTLIEELDPKEVPSELSGPKFSFAARKREVLLAEQSEK